MEHVMPAKTPSLPQRLRVGMLACGCHMAAPALVRRALALSFCLPLHIERLLPHFPASSETNLALATLALRRTPLDRAFGLIHRLVVVLAAAKLKH